MPVNCNCNAEGRTPVVDFFYNELCPFTQRVWIGLGELSVPHNKIHIDLDKKVRPSFQSNGACECASRATPRPRRPLSALGGSHPRSSALSLSGTRVLSTRQARYPRCGWARASRRSSSRSRSTSSSSALLTRLERLACCPWTRLHAQRLQRGSSMWRRGAPRSPPACAADCGPHARHRLADRAG